MNFIFMLHKKKTIEEKDPEQKIPTMTKDKLGWMLMYLLSKPHGATLEEIQAQWKKNLPLEKRHKSLQYRTFHNWCIQLKEGGRFWVRTDKGTGKYHLEINEYSNDDEGDIPLINYSLVDYEKIGRALNNRQLKNRVVNEPSYESEEQLDIITSAMIAGKVLHICYEKFGEDGYEIDVHPYALRRCQRRCGHRRRSGASGLQEHHHEADSRQAPRLGQGRVQVGRRARQERVALRGRNVDLGVHGSRRRNGGCDVARPGQIATLCIR
mgnify:CR=1 FL=1